MSQTTTLKLSDVSVGTPATPRYYDIRLQDYVELDARDAFLKRFADDGLVLATDEQLPEGDAYHRNVLEYLERCWADHLGVVMTPDMLWYTALCELVSVVKATPNDYRDLFTRSSETTEVTVITAETVVMPLNRLVQQLRPLVPTDASTFMPEFSTTTDAARHARYAAFCDMCSPYYDYMMMCCALPCISVQGDVDEWAYMASKWREVSRLFEGAGAWTTKVQEVLDNCTSRFNDSAWWRESFRLDRCGSGHQTEVGGWISTLFREGPRGPGYVGNYPTHVASVNYRNLDTDKPYTMRDGLFSSRFEGDFLWPEFGSLVHEQVTK